MSDTTFQETLRGLSAPLERSKLATGLWAYLLVGLFFGLVLVKSEAASWYRIQEMFRFQSFHMYGLMGSAVFTGLLSTLLLKKLRSSALDGEPLEVKPKEKGVQRYIYGGLLFGVGWGLAGVCPGPIFVLIGAGVWPMLFVLVFALLGTWIYGVLKERLPH